MKVDGTASFQGTVTDLLRELCACQKARIELGWVVLADAGDPCCCTHPIACTLVTNVVDECEVKIVGGYCNSTYDPDDNAILLCTDPDSTSLTCDGEPSPIVTSLAHEMIHAWLDCLGDDYSDEVKVICGENQIRKELGIPVRCKWGGTEVPMDCGWLPDEWDVDPDCRKTIRFWFCKVSKAIFKAKMTLQEYLDRAQARRQVQPSWDARMPPDAEPPWDRSGPPTLEKRIAQAEWVRERSPDADRIDRIVHDSWSRDTPPDFLMLLEEITIEHPYIVTLISRTGDTWEVVSNRRGASAPLARFHFTVEGDRAPALDELVGRIGPLPPADQPDRWGRPQVADGTVDTLTVIRGTDRGRTRTAIYGRYFLDDNPNAPPPEDPEERARWQSVNAFNDLRRALMSRPADLVEAVDDGGNGNPPAAGPEGPRGTVEPI